MSPTARTPAKPRSGWRKIILANLAVDLLLTVVVTGLYLALVGLTDFSGVMYWVTLVALIAIVFISTVVSTAIITAVALVFAHLLLGYSPGGRFRTRGPSDYDAAPATGPADTDRTGWDKGWPDQGKSFGGPHPPA